MISFALSLLAGVGLPAIVTGVIGKFLPSLFAGTIGKFLNPIVHLCMGLVDVLLMLLKWIMQKILAGLDHIVKSVPATLTVLLLMYGSYAYGDRLEHILGEREAVSQPRTAPPLPTRRNPPSAPSMTPGDWLRSVLKG